ncbi:MAG: hypothetical protein RMY34_09890 [Aulosira sp. DedQUE10]|nr:hypothetical protein [Aulosira sp. DedQUE10]
MPEPVLQEFLDFIQFLQAKHQEFGISSDKQPVQTLIPEHNPVLSLWARKNQSQILNCR